MSHDQVHESLWLILGLLVLAAMHLPDGLMVILSKRVAVILILVIAIAALLAVYVMRPKRMTTMDGLTFEDFVMSWLAEAGYHDLAKTEYFDQGVDLIGTKDGWSWGIQVKYSSRPVGVSAVRSAVAGIKAYGCHRSMVITNHSFTRPARQLAVINNCLLVDGKLLKLDDMAALQ